jgi:hypothetical protein
MGVTTTAYSVSDKMMKKVRTDNANLAYIFGEGDEGEAWLVDNHSFERIDTYISILHAAGCEKTAKSIDSGDHSLDEFDYDSDVWTVMPAGVKAMVSELHKADLISLKTDMYGEPITDGWGKALLASELESYLGDFDGVKEFLNKAAEQGNYLILSEG